MFRLAKRFGVKSEVARNYEVTKRLSQTFVTSRNRREPLSNFFFKRNKISTLLYFIIVGQKSRTRLNFPPLTNCSSFPIACTSIVMRTHNTKRELEPGCHNPRLLYIPRRRQREHSRTKLRSTTPSQPLKWPLR